MTTIRLFAAVLVALPLFTGEALAQPVPISVPPHRSSTGQPFADIVTEAARRFDLPPAWIDAVITVESDGDPRAVSPRGAMGLMQLMPSTWSEMRDRLAIGDDPFDPRANILAGSAYLREMLDRFGSPGFLAAYNAGPARYTDHLTTGRPLPAETRAYVALLEPMLGGEPAANAVIRVADNGWTTAPLFVERASFAKSESPRMNRPDSPLTTPPHPEGLFVSLSGSEHRP